jgi:hypothetical protein
VKVTRVAYSADLNAGKLKQLAEQAQRLGVIRSMVWRKHGSINGAGIRDRVIRDRLMADGTARSFAVPANAWKDTLRDAIANITANREAAKTEVRRAVTRRTRDPLERKRLFTALKRNTWTGDRYLCRLMRQYAKRGHNHTHNQVVVRADQYRTFTLTEQGNLWLAVPGLERRRPVKIPLDTTVAPTGTLRLIIRDDRVEVHYTIGAWTKGVNAEALANVSERRGSALRLVNAAYTSQVIPGADSDIGLHTPHTRVKQIIQERDRRRSRLPDQDSNTAGHCRCGERNIRNRSTLTKELEAGT